MTRRLPIAPRRVLGWLALVVLVELATRALVYTLSPSPLAVARGLTGALGGPGPVAVAVVAIGLAAALSAGLVWLASLGVRERWLLASSGRTARPPRIAVGRMLARAAGLWVASMLVFAAVESYLHWRAGLGFHGLGCLVGPVHRNAIAVAAAFSLIAAAAVTAAAYALAWMRRALGGVYGARLPARRRAVRPPAPALAVLADRLPAGIRRPRGPPVVLA